MLITILKRFWREIIIAVLVIVVSISVQTCHDKSRQIGILEDSRDSAFNYATTYIDKNGKLQQQVKTHEITIRELKSNGKNLGIDNDKLRKQVGKLTNLVGYWKGNASVSDTITVANTDTVIVNGGGIGKQFSWSNKYMEISGVTMSHSTSLQYKYDLDFTLVAYRKKHGPFGKSELLSDINFSDPNVNVKEFKGIVIKEAPKKWYERRGFQIGAAFLAGYIIAK